MATEDQSTQQNLPHGNPISTTVPFFAALRKIQAEKQALIGRDTNPVDEPARLKAEASLAYPAAEIARASTDEAGRSTFEVSFFGLFGPSGALPMHYTQLIMDRTRHKDSTLKDFLDIFNHRWLSLFYRAWEKHNYPSAFQTSQSLQEEDVLTRIFWALIGFGTKGQRGRLRLDESSMLYFTGLMADRRPRESALQAMIGEWFSVKVEVLQFEGQWLQIPEREQSRPQTVPLGSRSNNQLGVDAIAGSRVWNLENRFRLKIGPLRAAEFSEFSPTGQKLEQLCALTRTYVGPQFDFDVQVLVDRSEVPRTMLSGQSRLGWNTWLGDGAFDDDPDDAKFEIDDAHSVVM